MLKIVKSSVSIILNCGIGNILCLIANGIHIANQNGCKVEVAFIDMGKAHDGLMAYRGAAFFPKIYQPFGGHLFPKYPIEEFFPNIKFVYQIPFDKHIEHGVCHYNFDSFQKHSRNIYNCGFWNFDFVEQLPNIIKSFSINSKIAASIDEKYESLDFSCPCMHLRLGSSGDFVDITNRKSNKDIIARYLCNLSSKAYVLSDNYTAACEFFNTLSPKPRATILIINESCCLTSLYLMSKFKLQLLSKSTFAMWAAFLSQGAKIWVMPEFEDGLHRKLESWEQYPC